LEETKPVVSSIMFEDPDFKLLIVTGIESFINDLGKTNEVFHEEIEIKYFYEGSATLLIGSSVVPVEAGDIVVINPYEFHATIRFGEHIGKYHLYTVSLDFLNEGSGIGLNLRDLLVSGYTHFQTLIRNNQQMANILLRVAEEKMKNEPYRKVVTRGLMLEFFGLLLRSYMENGGSVTPVIENINHYKTVEPAIRRIRDGYAEKLTTDEFVSLCNITKSHFCRVFKKATGMTATKYLMEYRLQIADIMLKNSNASISEISTKCGFTDKNYFCRCYKSIYGISPNKNRKSSQIRPSHSN